MLATVALAVALLGAADYRSQYPLPSLSVPSGWGVNIHFNHPQPGEMEQIAAAGFRWIRYDFYWDQIEKQPGRYDFGNYDVLMQSLRRNRIRPIFILDYGNDLYQSGPPTTQRSRAAFCRFVEAAVQHFRHQGVVWEMWNEPNYPDFWKPEPNVDAYIALAAAVGQTIRRAAADEWYVGPATSTFDWSFLTRCFEAGLLRYWDAVTVHPYRKGPPESVASDWARLRNLIATHPGTHPVRMFAGEWGYSERDQNATVAEQGWYAARMYLSNLASGVPMTILYDWRDGSPLGDGVAHFGATDVSLRPKPAYLAVRHLATTLGGYTCAGRVRTASSMDYLYLFRKGNSVKYVGYTTRGSSTIPLPVGTAAVIVSAPSFTKSLPPGEAARSVTLSAQPRVFEARGDRR